MLFNSLFKSRIIIIFVCLLFGLVFASCGDTGIGNKTIPNLTGDDDDDDDDIIALTSKISGQVSSAISGEKVYISKARSAGVCAGSSYDEYVIGGAVDSEGNDYFESVYSGTSDGNGDFEADAPANDEVVFEFACGMRCFGSPGLTGLACDPASNAIVEALEEALGENVKDSNLYRGLSIATMAAGLVEVLKAEQAMCDKLPDSPSCTSVTLDNLLDTSSTSTPYETIQASSTLSGLFNSLKTLADEIKIYNQTGDEDSAAELSWTIDNIISMLTGLGISVNIDINGTGNGPDEEGLYGPMMANIESWVFPDQSKGLLTNLKPYLIRLYDKIYVSKETSQVALYCEARKEVPNSPSVELKYQPFKVIDGEGVYYLTCMVAGAWPDPITNEDIGTDKLGITTSGSLNPNWRINLRIAPSFTEPDRNDITGEHSNDDRMDEQSVEVINVYQEFMDSMANSDPVTGCGEQSQTPRITIVDDVNDVITMNFARPIVKNVEVRLVSSTGILPDPLVECTGVCDGTNYKKYYVKYYDVSADGEFSANIQLADVADGAAVEITQDLFDILNPTVHLIIEDESMMYFDDDATGETFAACVTRTGLDRYFSGLLGIYKFMRNSSLRSGKFSLWELHEAFSDVYYMGVRPDIDMWSLGLNNNDVRLSWGGSWDYHINPYMLKDSVYGAYYQIVCPEGGDYPFDLCTAGEPIDTGDCDMAEIGCLEDGDSDPTRGDFPPISVTTTQVTNFLKKFQPHYNHTMRDFEDIPTMDDIEQSIFQDAHHEPYNIKGSETFYARGGKGTVYQQESEAPILCKILNPNAAGDFAVRSPVSASSQIVCEHAGGTWIDGDPDDSRNPDGTPVNPYNGKTTREYYEKWYAIVDRGGSSGENGNDKYYGLLNFRNGTDYTLNGRDFRVRGVMEGVAPGVAMDGQTVYPVNRDVCNTYTEDGVSKTHCWKEIFDYVAVQFPDEWYPDSSYYPYTWKIPYPNQPWETSIAIHDNESADNSDDVAVCLAAAAVPVDDFNPQRVDGPIVPAGNIIDCFGASLPPTYYYLQPYWNSDITSPADIDNFKYGIFRNDGTYMWSDLYTGGVTDTVLSVDLSGSLQVADASVYSLNQQVKLTTTVALPSPLYEGDVFYVIPVDTTHIALKHWDNDPEQITFNDTGTGTHTIVRNMQWDSTVTKQAIEDELHTMSVCGPAKNELCDAAVLGPSVIYENLPGYEIANLGHDPKYDPFCDDWDNDGHCNCLKWLDSDKDGVYDWEPADDMALCTLEDAADPSEPTLSQSPYNTYELGDPLSNASKVKYLLEKYPGARTSVDLADNLDIDAVDISTVNTDWSKLFVCENGREMERVETQKLADGKPNAGRGCGQWSFDAVAASDVLTYSGTEPDHTLNNGEEITIATNVAQLVAGHVYYVIRWSNTEIKLSETQSGAGIVLNATGTVTLYGGLGTVRMIRMKQRNNAYNVARPNSLMRLITAATASTGTGVHLSPTTKVFSFQEALSLMFLRLNMPSGGTVYGPGATPGTDDPISGASIYFRRSELPNNHNDPVSGLMRAFLEQAGYIECYDGDDNGICDSEE